MQPHLPVGTLVVTERVPASQIRDGDVVVFARPGHAGETVVHRVTRITPTGDGALQAHTRGDANPVEDPWTLRVAPGTQVDRGVAAVASLGGDVARARRLALTAAIALIVLSTLIHGLRRIWSP